MSRTWKIQATYNSYAEASEHRSRLENEGFVPGDTVKVKRCGEGGMQYAVKTADVSRSEAQAKEVSNG